MIYDFISKITGNTFGYSEIIFGLTHLLGLMFAPRIKNFKDQQLYGVHSPKYYQQKGYQLTPKRKINFEIIQENWEDILRFILTIKSRRTTASQLLKRLTSYSKHHKLYTAIKEFGKIIKTDFLLTYIDDVELRQTVSDLSKMRLSFGTIFILIKSYEMQSLKFKKMKLLMLLKIVQLCIGVILIFLERMISHKLIKK